MGTSLGVSEYQFTGPAVRVAQQYIDAIAGHRYEAAYALLGPALQTQQTFDDFVAGYADTDTAAIAVVAVRTGTDGGARLHVRIGARHTDGTLVRFRGTYDIAPIDGALKIRAASIRPAAAQP